MLASQQSKDPENTSGERYAPILVIVYDRVLHLKKCIESLARCPEAKVSDLYIATDAAKTHEDELKVEEVRRYIREIKGFSSVTAIERKANLGLYQNGTLARNMIFEFSDSIIMLEDDVVVGSGFLAFMNEGLRLYKSNENVVGICGYLPLIDVGEHPFFLKVMTPYGYANWRDKRRILDSYRKPEYFDDRFKDFKFFRRLAAAAPEIIRALPLIIQGRKKFGDIELEFIMQDLNLLSLYPPVSLTKSIGNDGSGVHAKKNTQLQNQVVSHRVFDASEIQDLVVEENRDAAFSLWRSRKRRGDMIVNHLVFFQNRFLKKLYPAFLLIRRVVKAF